MPRKPLSRAGLEKVEKVDVSPEVNETSSKVFRTLLCASVLLINTVEIPRSARTSRGPYGCGDGAGCGPSGGSPGSGGGPASCTTKHRLIKDSKRSMVKEVSNRENRSVLPRASDAFRDVMRLMDESAPDESIQMFVLDVQVAF